MNISKELLSEVLDLKQEIQLVEYSDITKIVNYYHNAFWRQGNHINIYELTHKCKIWALGKGYWIASETLKDMGKAFALSEDMTDFTIEANTEVEAIIEACERILNE